MALAFSTRNVAARPQAAPRAAGRQLRLPVRAAAAANAEVPGQCGPGAGWMGPIATSQFHADAFPPCHADMNKRNIMNLILL